MRTGKIGRIAIAVLLALCMLAAVVAPAFAAPETTDDWYKDFESLAGELISRTDSLRQEMDDLNKRFEEVELRDRLEEGTPDSSEFDAAVERAKTEEDATNQRTARRLREALQNEAAMAEARMALDAAYVEYLGMMTSRGIALRKEVNAAMREFEAQNAKNFDSKWPERKELDETFEKESEAFEDESEAFDENEVGVSKMDEEETELLERAKEHVVCKGDGFEISYAFDDGDLYLAIENDREDEVLSIKCEDLKVNGEVVDGVELRASVDPGETVLEPFEFEDSFEFDVEDEFDAKAEILLDAGDGDFETKSILISNKKRVG